MSMPKMPGMPKRYRVASYIDGFNLYHGLRESDWRRFLWLDLIALSKSLLRDDQDLGITKYFTTRIGSPEPKRKRQSDYLEALETHCGRGLQMYFGHYQIDPWRCDRCNQTSHIPHEKKTDVNIAVEMMRDAFEDRYDTALLISADSDLVPVIQAIQQIPSKRILVAFPPARSSAELKSEASACFSIGRAKFAMSQLPERVRTTGSQILERPEKWRPLPDTDFGQKLSNALGTTPRNHPKQQSA